MFVIEGKKNKTVFRGTNRGSFYSLFPLLLIALIRDIRVIRGSEGFRIFRVTSRRILRTISVNGEK